MRRTVAVLVVPVLLAAAACGGGDEEVKAKQASLADVTVTGSPAGKPTVDFNAPVSFPETERKIIEKGPGKGDAVRDDSLVTLHYLGINARDGQEFASNWDQEKPEPFPVNTVIAGFAKGLDGAHAGDRVSIAVASKDGYDPTGNGGEILKGDSLVFVIDVLDVANPLAEATGKKVAAPPTLPTLTYDKDDHPKAFKAGKDVPKDIDKLGAFAIIEGTGPPVKSGQTLTVEYVGQLYPDGKVFDESWSRDEPVTVGIGTGNVIPGWDQGLTGPNVGSRVVLTIPSDLAYGKAGSPPDIGKNADLVFVIDILQAY